MGFVDWLKQTASNVGTFFTKTLPTAVKTGVEWTNQNIVQPVAKELGTLPVIGQPIQLIGRAGQAAENLTKMAAGEKKFNLGEALGGVQTIADVKPKELISAGKQAWSDLGTRTQIQENLRKKSRII